MTNLWEPVAQGVDYMCNMILDAVDRVCTFVSSKVGELSGKAAEGAVNSMQSAGSGIRDSIAPNAIGKASAPPSPSQGQTLSRSPEAPAAAPKQDYSSMMAESGFSMESLASIGVESVTDFGSHTYGDAVVGCAAPDAPRAMATGSLFR
jgi:hypothetical protein